jgi:hypothetical protein
MQVLNRQCKYWEYAPEEIRGLLGDGEIMLAVATERKNDISDFSFLVFPFSKAYEGFLKKLFLDLRLIREDEYFGDDIRIGRILNPKYIQEHNSVYRGLGTMPYLGSDFSDRLWNVWKRGRNQVFHYFPHNFRKLSYDEALEIIRDIINAMDFAVEKTKVCEIKAKKTAKTLKDITQLY